MRRDPIVLGQNYILSGSDIGKKRPNANALIVGTTGCGKSTSVVLPTIGRMEYSNPIFNSAEYKEYLRANKLAENLRGRMMDDYT